VNTIATVLKRPTYAMITIIISIALGSLFWYLTFSFTPLLEYIKMYGMTFTVSTISLGFAIAVLTALNSSLVIFRKKITGSLGFKRGATSSTCSALTGAIASGCPVCTMPILGVFGLGSAIALFPLQGIELKIAATVALIISLYFTTKNVRITCKVA